MTRDPRDVPWQKDTNWVLKPAMGRVGESIGLAGVTTLVTGPKFVDTLAGDHRNGSLSKDSNCCQYMGPMETCIQ